METNETVTTEPTEAEVLEAIHAYSQAERAKKREKWLGAMREIIQFFEDHPELDTPSDLEIAVTPALEYSEIKISDKATLRPWLFDSTPDRYVAWLQESIGALKDGAPVGSVEKFDTEYYIGAKRTLPAGGTIKVFAASTHTCEIKPVLDDDGNPVVERKPKTEIVETVVEGEYEYVPVTKKICPPFISRDML